MISPSEGERERWEREGEKRKDFKFKQKKISEFFALFGSQTHIIWPQKGWKMWKIKNCSITVGVGDTELWLGEGSISLFRIYFWR